VRIALVIALAFSQFAISQVADAAPHQSLIPPVVLQGCAEKVTAAHASWLAGGLIRRAAAGSAQGEQTVGFDVSFVNTSQKAANLVLVRVGATDFAKTGTFTPNAVIAWRLAAKSGSECAIRAVRFEDGSEWSAGG
jgi:hypothetical protein